MSVPRVDEQTVVWVHSPMPGRAAVPKGDQTRSRATRSDDT
ncbi:hypothetical protein [Alloactinosynnema sp. L-07]|nr:hypothetical protein [Alloactinosynnema sp. L-07]